MKNPVASLLSRRRKRRRFLRDLREAAAIVKSRSLGRGSVYVGDRTVLAPTHYEQWIYLATEDSSVCPRIMTTGTWEAGTTAFLQSHVLKGMNYVEVGANYGYFSLQAAVLVGREGGVDAFEPLPRAASLVRRTFLANGGARWCRLHEYAVSDREGAATLHGVVGNHGGGQLAPHVDLPGREYDSVEVQTVTLDKFLGDKTVHFLKMDAQGVEGLVLDGARALLERSPGIVMVLEMCVVGWREVGRPAPEVLGELEDSGFKFWRIHERTGRASQATIQDLCADPKKVFDFVCAREVPAPRPGMQSMFADNGGG